MEHLDEAAKVPFIDVGEKKLESSRSKRRTTMFAQIRRISQWRRTVYLGAVAATFTLLVNIVVLVWIASTCSSSSQNGVATIFTGSCDTSQRLITGIDLAVNILSTILLSVGTGCSQLLAAPTRAEIDRAHSSGTWLNIGIATLHNLRRIQGVRVLVWALLLLSSVPVHLLYNSVFFATSAANDYTAAVVTKDFITGSYWNQSRSIFYYDPTSSYVTGSEVTIDTALLVELQHSAADLKELDVEQCVEAFGFSAYEWQWRSVLLVTTHRQLDSLVTAFTHSAGSSEDLDWMCYGNPDSACSPQVLARNITSAPWTLYITIPCSPDAISYDGEFDHGNANVAWAANCTVRFDAEIEYCLAQPSEGHCEVQASMSLLSIVIGCNVLKVLCLLASARWRDFEPIATIGDAVSSFLSLRDATTSDMGPICVTDVCRKDTKKSRGRGMKETRQEVSLPFRVLQRRWLHAQGKARWASSLAILSLSWSLVLILFMVEPEGGEGYLRHFHNPAIDDVLGNESSLTLSAIIVNLPQLVLSLVFVCYNNTLAIMLNAHEYASFASARKPLRVSNPRGKQRSTYWLHLPYRYIVPIMVIMTLMHWLLSRSIYLVHVKFYGSGGSDEVQDAIAGYGISALPLLLMVIMGAILLTALIVLSLRQLDPGIPLAGSNSVAISAACHPNPGDDHAAELSVMYGVELDADVDEHDRVHAAFSSRAVRSLNENDELS